MGDDPQYAVSVMAGTRFAGGRGHVLISAEEHYTDGIPDAQNARSWVAHDWGQITNPAYTPTNGQPFYLNVQNAGSAAYARGGSHYQRPSERHHLRSRRDPATVCIWESARRHHDAGVAIIETPPVRSTETSGTDMSLDIHLNRQNLFLRSSYDITDDIQVYGQYVFSYSNVYSNGRYNYSSGTIQSGNPFIPQRSRRR